jgi:hypothetical protein
VGETPKDIEGAGPVDRLRVFSNLVLIPKRPLHFSDPSTGEPGVAGLERPKSAEQPKPAVKESNAYPVKETERAEPVTPTPVKAMPAGKSRPMTIHGYVTAVKESSFEIEDYRITRNDSFALNFEHAGPDVTFTMDQVRVGTELEIRGRYYEDTGDLIATGASIDLEQFRKQKSTAILSRTPVGLQKSESGWSGAFFADGQRVRVTPQTAVLFKLTSEEKRLEKAAEKGNATQKDLEAFRPLSSLAEIMPGMIMSYEGMRDMDTGVIIAQKVEFAKNVFEVGEQILWKQSEVRVKPSNFVTLQPGEISSGAFGRRKLLPNEEVQEYVTKIGKSLEPKYLSSVPDDDRGKLHFQYYVVIDKEPNAFALANGVFVVQSGLFDVLQNEAQLATVIGHEIAHATQKHLWREQQNKKTLRAALQIGAAVAEAFGQYEIRDAANLTNLAIHNGYQRSMENQADRVGLASMVDAGYDPRQAPAVWKAFTSALGFQATDFFYSNHDDNATRRSYLMNEVRNNYADLDYSKLRIGEDEYRRIAKLVKQGSSGKRNITVR